MFFFWFVCFFLLLFTVEFHLLPWTSQHWTIWTGELSGPVSPLRHSLRVINKLSTLPLLYPMSTTADSSIFLFNIQLHSHPSLKTLSSYQCASQLVFAPSPDLQKISYPFWGHLRTSLSNTPQNSLGNLTSWQCRKICKATVSRAPDNMGAQVYVGILIDLVNSRCWGVLSETIPITLTAFIPSVSLYSTSLELSPFSSGHRIFISTVEGKIFISKYLSNSIVLFKVLSCCSSKVNK